MTLVGPFDLAIAALLAVRRFGIARTMLFGVLMTPVYLWSRPPVACGCFRPLFVRCDYSLRYRAVLKSDLKNLASAQEIYFADYGRYTADWQELGFVESSGVSVTLVGSEEAWEAVATHAAIGEGEGCALYVGAAPVSETALIRRGHSGEIVCST